MFWPDMFATLNCFNNRYTILEPGPIDTPIFQTAEDWGKAIDHETADGKTKKLKEMAVDRLQQLISKKTIKSIEVAAIVKEIILGQKTNFRCLTNVDFLNEEIAAKLKDSATNKPIEMMRMRFFEEQKDEN